ncbi:hypothetical protein A2767_02075 [Candidatus Roizmanbacteria bacterium RIFCSPHIGHO2_01_FULL_35_10]|uniref:YbaK/aminoacyl-tRNA synthetase-associated domain-containing protein n=1 Tax=Candidatus Roizmanbacteria bacterium RIFCSPLOWO2_01_FULL_35_13 TaxID=1802055 RepID=A0A1F7I7A4_9BACT|nr:MAG: hypothetical protein A2767_02075 [Candidatus Roizmanbacteria bacterium RIFCSPHIGHO2_01_FULL_35_10]OGK39248.1 MAG: hypothetical protein A3A74_07495 [Candidatus Roizmanbacteria bacterium RIFCSPLOWO2_01_FULL_35_13]
MKTFQSIKQKLVKNRIIFNEITFPNKAVSARTEAISLTNNYNPKNAIKTLVVKTKNSYYGLIMRGSDLIDDKKLKKYIGKWSIVNTQTLKERFGFLPGCVCPLDLDLPYLIDVKVNKLEVWSIGAGDPKKGINIQKDIAISLINNFHVVSLT